MRECCICGKKHNTYIGKMPLCLSCLKLVYRKRTDLSAIIEKLNMVNI